MKSSIQSIGVIGGNLLSTMICLEAKKRGIQTVLLEEEINSIATDVADQHIISTINSKAIERLALRTDAMIFCSSEIPILPKKLVEENKMYPSEQGIDLVANRVEQLMNAQLADVPTPKFYHQNNKIAFLEQMADIKIPFKLYQIYQDEYEITEVNEPEDIETFLFEIDDKAVEWLIEEVGNYDRVFSISAIKKSEKVYTYPVQEELLSEEDVKYVQVPADITKSTQQKLTKYAKKLLKEVETEGLFSFKFGMKKNRSVELLGINPGITVGDLVTKHCTDLSIYEQFFNLIEDEKLKDGVLTSRAMLTVVEARDCEHVPQFPYHKYLLDKNNKMPVSLYVKTLPLE